MKDQHHCWSYISIVFVCYTSKKIRLTFLLVSDPSRANDLKKIF